MDEIERRFWRKVDVGGVDDCWPFRGHLIRGYGQFSRTHTQPVSAHRFVYVLAIGTIPDGLTVDHLCHDPETCDGGPTCPHRRCVNPRHLGLATRGANVMRGNTITARNAAKTRCVNGHELAGANLRVDPKSGDRCCRACGREATRRYRERLRS